MPVLPYRTQIREAVLARLDTIAAGATYWTTPALITSELLGIDQYDGTSGGTDYLATGPVIGVIRTPGSEITRDTHDIADGESDDGLPAGWSGNFRFALVLYVRAAAGETSSDALEKAQQDVEVCLLDDPTLAGLVSDLRPDGPDDNDGGALERQAYSVQEWLARKWPSA